MANVRLVVIPRYGFCWARLPHLTELLELLVGSLFFFALVLVDFQRFSRVARPSSLVRTSSHVDTTTALRVSLCWRMGSALFSVRLHTNHSLEQSRTYLYLLGQKRIPTSTSKSLSTHAQGHV